MPTRRAILKAAGAISALVSVPIPAQTPAPAPTPTMRPALTWSVITLGFGSARGRNGDIAVDVVRKFTGGLVVMRRRCPRLTIGRTHRVRRSLVVVRGRGWVHQDENQAGVAAEEVEEVAVSAEYSASAAASAADDGSASASALVSRACAPSERTASAN